MTLEEIKQMLKEISPWPWCESFCWEAIRHIDRNCYDEPLCCDHEYDDPLCKKFGCDGHFIAKAPEIIDQLVKKNEIMKAALENIIRHQDIILQSSTGWAVSTTSSIATDALKQCEELEK